MMLRICGCLAAALCLLAGCDSDLGLVPVTGTVTLDGEPQANKSLIFTPQSGEGTRASAITDASGKYELLAILSDTTSDMMGAKPGRYKVTVFEAANLVGGGDDMGGVLVPGETDAPKGGIPIIYQDQARTPLLAEVPEGGGTVNLELKSK